MTETIAIYSLAILLLLTFTFFIVSFKKLKVAKMAILDLANTNDELNNQIAFINSDEQKIHSENFIKFLSDSREWAFDYIEKVQVGLNTFVKDIEKEIEHFDKYGETISTPLNKSMEKISKSYKNLKTLLPENEEKK